MIVSLFLSVGWNLSNAAPTTVSVSPSSLNVGSPSTELPVTFTVDITVTDVADLWGWQLNLTWDPQILQLVRAFLPSNNIFGSAKTVAPQPIINNTKGQVLWGVQYMSFTASFSGSGILCTLEFEAIKAGSSPLTMTKLPTTITNPFPTTLYDVDCFDIEPLSYVDGTVNVEGYIPVPIYTYLKISPSQQIVGSYQPPPVSSSVNVTVTNAEDLIGWQINLTYSPEMLQIENVTRPSDDVFGNKTIISIDPVINNSTGFITWNVTLQDGEPPFSGNGTLCQIDFNGTALGISTFTFIENETRLLNSTHEYIKTDFFNGVVQIKQDFTMAILEVAPYQLNVTGPFPTYYLVNITVTNVTDLYEWCIDLTFNSTYVVVENATIPDNNVFAGRETAETLKDIDNIGGSILWDVSITEGLSFYGNGTLCQIWFRGIAEGISNMTFIDYGERGNTYLKDPASNMIDTTLYHALAPPPVKKPKVERGVGWEIFTGPLGVVLIVVAIYIVYKLRKRRLDRIGDKPIYFKEKTL